MGVDNGQIFQKVTQEMLILVAFCGNIHLEGHFLVTLKSMKFNAIGNFFLNQGVGIPIKCALGAITQILG
jgi:hypothetical protein